MDIRAQLPGFANKQVTIRTAGMLSGPKLLVNGLELRKANGAFRAVNDSGMEVPLKFKTRFFDPIPNVVVAGSVVQVAPPLPWYEYAWMMLPIFLAVAGGLIGALFGIPAIYASSHIFRSDRPVAVRYLLTGIISACSVVAYIFTAATVLSAFKH
jgi:hypothetical protein